MVLCYESLQDLVKANCFKIEVFGTQENCNHVKCLIYSNNTYISIIKAC